MYLIYRVYSRDERPDESFLERQILYGWTKHKCLIKIFFQQRSKSKYKVIKIHKDDLEKFYSEPLDDTTKLDILPLRSRYSDDLVKLISTDKELSEWEYKLRTMLEDVASLESVKGSEHCLELFANIDDKYKDALSFIGYTPREMESLFPSSVLSMDEFESELYSRHSDGNIKSSMNAVDPKDQVIFSLEAFIKIMKDDM